MFSRNPPNPYHALQVTWDEPPPPARLVVREDHAAGLLQRNDSPDLGFRWSANPYRGCTHACAYCYARRTHEYLDLGAGEDFERVVFVKRRAPELLAEAFERPSWAGEVVALSGVTDCYQPLERRHRLTRALLEVCARYRNPVGIVTRSPLVTRDLDLLADLASEGAARVHLSIPLLDPTFARALEPGAPPPEARLAAIAALARAGVPVGVSVAPVIPGLSDHTLARTLTLAREAGADWAWMSLLRLPGSVRAVFEERLRERLPGRAEAVLDRLQRARGSSDEAAFGARMRGEGEGWSVIEQLFRTTVARLGFPGPPAPPARSPFRRPGAQLALFG